MATNSSKIKTNLGELNLSHYTNEDGIEIILFNSLKVEIGKMPGVSFGKPEFEKTTDLEGKGEILCNVCVKRKTDDGEVPYWGFGEVSLTNLDSSIAIEYSYTMARNRALSDAFLVMLGLSGRYYSSEQIKSSPDTSTSDNKTSKSNKANKQTQKKTETAPKTETESEEYEKPLTFPPLEEETSKNNEEKTNTKTSDSNKKNESIDNDEVFFDPFAV